MAKAVRHAELEALLIQAAPVMGWILAPDGMTPGRVYLDFNRHYGGWNLVEITTKSGGERSINESGRLPGREMASFLRGIILAGRAMRVVVGGALRALADSPDDDGDEKALAPLRRFLA